MPNCCVAAGCGNMPSDSVSLFRFPKDSHIVRCMDQTSSVNAGGLEPCSVCQWLRQNSSAESNVWFAIQRNRVLTSMAVPSISKHNDDVPEKKPRKLKTPEKPASKMVGPK